MEAVMNQNELETIVSALDNAATLADINGEPTRQVESYYKALEQARAGNFNKASVKPMLRALQYGIDFETGHDEDDDESYSGKAMKLYEQAQTILQGVVS
jgi:hypothetical protein